MTLLENCINVYKLNYIVSNVLSNYNKFRTFSIFNVYSSLNYIVPTENINFLTDTK